MHDELGPNQIRVLRALAGTWADKCCSEYLLPSIARQCDCPPRFQDIQAALADPFHSLLVIFAHYAFSRRGRDRNDACSLAIEALKQVKAKIGFPSFLRHSDGSVLWEEFVAASVRKGKKPNEELNLGVVAGFAELAQEIFRSGHSGSIFEWFCDVATESNRIEEPFLRMVDIRGVGPKVVSTLARDAVFLFGVEEDIEPVDLLFLQPINKYIRDIAVHVVAHQSEADSPDWILAGKISKYARRAGVSGIRFNIGANHFGSHGAMAVNFLEAIHSL